VARVFLGERIHWRTYFAIALALVGLAVMFTGDANGSSNNIVGDLAALSSAAGFAFYAAIVRSAPDRDWTPVLPGYGAIAVTPGPADTLQLTHR
jgi:drug/metabolite transporter (DMT)-like permease